MGKNTNIKGIELKSIHTPHEIKATDSSSAITFIVSSRIYYAHWFLQENYLNSSETFLFAQGPLNSVELRSQLDILVDYKYCSQNKD